MTFQNRFQYAGLKPYENERSRAEAGEMTHHEYELLSRDDTYRKLAELRWLVSEFERDLGADDADLTEETRATLARTVAEAAVPLSEAVDRYVDRWLDTHRATETGEV